MLISSRALIATLVGISFAAPLLSQDTINLKDGSTKQGTIQDADFRGVKLSIASGGGTTTVKAEDIASITLGNPPKEFKAGEDDMGRNRYEEAVANFQAVVDNKKNRPIFRQEAYVRLTEAYVRLDKADEAIKAAKAHLDEFPQSRHLSQTHDLVNAILVKTGKAADAKSYAESEEARVSKLDGATALVDRLKLQKARAALAAGDPKGAKTEASAIASGTSPGAGAAKVLLAEIAVAEKNIPEAKKLFQDALKVVTTRSDKASAFNGLGMIILDEGKAGSKTDLIRAALEFFLRTTLVLPPDAGESTEAHETGIFRAAECFQYLGELGAPSAGSKSESKSEAKADEAQGRNLARARELFRRLIRDYPQSKYASDAQTRLQKLGG